MNSKVTLANVVNDVEATFHNCGYLDVAMGDPAKLAYNAMTGLQNVEFDTMVGRGLSGALVVPIIARVMNKYFAIVRKPGDTSHSGREIEGQLGKRWIFVDDLICTGDTLKKSFEVINRTKQGMNFKGMYLYGTSTMMENNGSRFLDDKHCNTWYGL